MQNLKYIFLLIVFNSFSQPNWQVLTNVSSNINNQRFDDIFFLDENIGWAANGFYAAVYKTLDGGETWTQQLNESMLGGNYYFRNIEFLDKNIGFLGTLNGEFFKTTDGGDNWTEVTNINPNPSAICGLDAVGTSTIYGCGAYFTPAHIIKSSDSGATWQYIDMSAYANALVEIYFLTENIGFASGRNSNGATILKTTDGGTNWNEIYNSNIVGEYVWKLQILDNNTDVIFGSITAVTPNPGKLISTSDGGINWNSYNAPETDVQAVGFISETHGWMGGHTTGVYETLDGGISWTNLNVGNNLNKIFIVNSTLAYATGTSLYKFSNTTLSTDFTVEANRTALQVTLKNNPISTTLEFSIDFDSSDNIMIELYDYNGKYIRQLALEEIQTKINKTYRFNVEELSAGIYFINFHNNTGRQSLKFIKK